MDDFKKRLRDQLVALTAGLLAACCLLLFSGRYASEATISEATQGFIDGFQAGIAVALFGFLLFFVVRNAMALRNPERLRKLYISETDERILLIRQKSGSAGMNIIMYGLMVGTAVSGNINPTVFFSLLGASLFVATIRGFMKQYYRTRY